MHKYIFVIAVFALLVSGCGFNFSAPDAGTPTPVFITSTLPPGPSLSPPEATQPATAAPTPIPIEGTTTSQVNVRGEPSTASAPLAIIAAFAKVQIIGKDPSGNWYQIAYAQSANGKGWITAQYVDVKDRDAIPVIGAAPGSGSAPSGVVIQQVNVRSGPGTSFDALGTLNPNDVVALTGKDPNGAWLQIQFANGPDGKGWVTAAYVQASGADSLPIIGQTGDVVGTGTPTITPPTITPTLAAAMQDGDSAQSPAVNIIFSPSGKRALIYSSDVSAPQGDAEDWIQFTPYNGSVVISLSCSGNGQLKAELLQNSVSQTRSGLTCGETKTITVSAGQVYLFNLSAVSASGGLEYVHYTLAVETAR